MTATLATRTGWARLSTTCVLLLLVTVSTACSSPAPEEPPAVMPSVEGQRLDVAYSDLARVGVEKDEVEVVGGGTFGVVEESNWTVCSQDPPAGQPPRSVRVVVDRSCDAATTGEPTGGSDVVETFTMPELVGANLQEAQDTLQGLDSYLLDQEDASGQGRSQVLDANWKVCEQRPAAGTTVKITTIVMLSSVKLDEDCP